MTSRAAEHARRFVQALAGATFVAAGCGVYETAIVRAAAGPSDAPAFGACFAVTFGLLAPAALVVGTLVALGFAFLSPENPPSLSLWIGKLRGLGTGRQADLAAFVPLLVLAAFVWMTAAAHLARAVLSLDLAAGLAGFAIAGGVLGIGFCLAVLVLASVPMLRRALARLSATQPAGVDPVVTGGFALLVAASLFAAGVATGTVSGEGNVLGIYGIFKRPELDLRAAAEALAMAIGATIGPSFARPPRTLSRSILALVALVALAPILLFVRDAKAMNRETAMSLAIERSAPLAKLVLKPARHFTDFDHDGYSGLFGGGDCDDHDRTVHPGATELGKDCSGTVLTEEQVEEYAPIPVVAKVDEALFPKDLNIVFITVDTLRADLGYAGYSKGITPNIDAFAARSTVFDHAYSLASFTGRSMGPLFIGKYASETNRNWGHFNKFNEKDSFITERLHTAGFRTLSIQGHPYFGSFGGFERGVDVLDISAIPAGEQTWAVASKSTSEELTNAALAQMAKDENTGHRFFLWVHYLDPHKDYLHHEGFDFGSDARGLYDGEVGFTDKHIGRLLEAIAKAPYADKTAIVLTSDHGEGFGEHGKWEHGVELWEMLVHVPLIVYVPGAKPHHITLRRSAIDVVPTLLDLAHVERPKGDDGSTDFLSGYSLLGDVFPKGAPGPSEGMEPKDGIPPERDIFIDMAPGPYNCDPRRSLIHADMKLIVSNESHYELFDLAKDPDEHTNVAESEPDKLKDMKQRYAAFRSRLHEVKVTGPCK